MFAKIATIMLVLGLTGCGLLALRQARLQAASEAAQAQLRIARGDEQLLSMRAQIASGVTPQHIALLAAARGGLRPATNDIPGALARNELRGLFPQFDTAQRRTVPNVRPRGTTPAADRARPASRPPTSPARRTIAQRSDQN